MRFRRKIETMGLAMFDPRGRVFGGAWAPPGKGGGAPSMGSKKAMNEQQQVAPPAPDVIEPVIGYRIWRVSTDGKLFSPYYFKARRKRGLPENITSLDKNLTSIELYELENPWGVNATATCTPSFIGSLGVHTTPAPFEPCGCGLYAYYDCETATVKEQHMWLGRASQRPLSLFAGMVMGVVSAWGVIHAHEQGFRAQHMRISALHPVSFSEGAEPGMESAREWAHSHNIPWIRHRHDLAGYGRLIGETLPVHLRGVQDEEEFD